MEGENTEIHVSDAVAGVHDKSLSNCGVCTVDHPFKNDWILENAKGPTCIDNVIGFSKLSTWSNTITLSLAMWWQTIHITSHYKVQWVQSPKMEILIHLLQLAHRGWTGCDGEREAWKQTLCWTYQSSSRLCMTYRNLFALSQNRIVPFFKCTDVIIDVCAAIRFSNGDSRIKRRVKCSSSASICVLNVEVGFVCLFWPR